MRIEGELERNVEKPILLITASPNKINSLARLHDLQGQLIGQKRGDHDVVEGVFLGPEFVVGDSGVGGDEEFAERVVDLTLYHPSLDHRQNRSRHFLENPVDELLRIGAAVHGECVDGRAYSTSFQILNGINDKRQPFHSVEWLLHPKI